MPQRYGGMEGGSFANALMIATGAAILSYIPIGTISSNIGRKKNYFNRYYNDVHILFLWIFICGIFTYNKCGICLYRYRLGSYKRKLLSYGSGNES